MYSIKEKKKSDEIKLEGFKQFEKNWDKLIDDDDDNENEKDKEEEIEFSSKKFELILKLTNDFSFEIAQSRMEAKITVQKQKEKEKEKEKAKATPVDVDVDVSDLHFFSPFYFVCNSIGSWHIIHNGVCNGGHLSLNNESPQKVSKILNKVITDITRFKKILPVEYTDVKFFLFLFFVLFCFVMDVSSLWLSKNIY